MPKKIQGNNLPQLRIEDIKRKDLLVTNRSGTVIWQSPSVDFAIDFALNNVCVTESGEGFLNLESVTYYEGGRAISTTKLDKAISLKSTPCGFGGKRVWFVCPKCKTQAGVLFIYNAELACRKCHNLSYRSQNTRHRMTSIGKLEKLKNAVGRSYYRGKRTKTYLRYLRKRDQTMKAIDVVTGSISKRMDKIGP